MKKVLSITIILLCSLFSKAQDNLIIETFLKSSEFSRIEKKVSELGNVNLSISKVYYYEENKDRPVGQIYITKNDEIKALIEIVSIPEQYENVLPNNDRFAAQLIDYSLYDPKSLSGTIQSYDLNYDNYLCAQVDVEKSNVIKFDAYGIPEEIKEKYQTVKKLSELIIFTNSETEKKKHFCDKNGNGNVSFGECYGCMKSACNGSPDCSALCALVNAASGATNVPRQCDISMGAACVIIAIAY